jgi:protocatechuate 3,4-dioxygenase beta subunit
MKIYCILLLGISRQMACAQPDSLSLLQEAATRLQHKTTTVSAILSDKKYLQLHPATAFRELIKDHCTASALTITVPDEPGRKIKVMGSVTDRNGNPVAEALVYLYQTDTRGWYAADAPHVLQNEGDFRHARLFGYVKTDSSGQFELHTVKPSGYPRSNLPAHIHVHVTASGYVAYGTEFLFDDDERLKGGIREDALRNRFLVAKPEKGTGPFEQLFSYKMELSKQ